jgi:hypothetical protein
MGHQTEASRQRYRHLFPEDLRLAINVLNFEQQQLHTPLRVVG